MNSNTYLLIILCAVAAFSIAFLWYRKTGIKGNLFWMLILLRGFALWSLGVLLINPVFKNFTLYTEKPVLNVLVDNSSSIKYLSHPDSLYLALNNLRENRELQDVFDIRWYRFGTDMSTLDSLPDFQDPQTNIALALQRLKKLQSSGQNATLLISDGNSTYGGDYQFNISGLQGPVYTLVAGDTTTYEDVYIEKINVNRYAFLNNKFPVEIFSGYSGDRTINSQLVISKNNNVVARKNITLEPGRAASPIRIDLEADRVGVSTYKVSITAPEGEKNTTNNTNSFAVEVIDERNRIALIASSLHPDIGSLKTSIESSGQRTVDLLSPDTMKEAEGYDLFILYQPDRTFDAIFSMLKEQKINFWIIGGGYTDWEFVNKAQDLFDREVTYTSELILGEVNSGFNSYQFEDPGIAEYPPLDSYLGDFIIINAFQTLIAKNLGGIPTESPLLFTTERNDQRVAVLDGSGLWKWRVWHYALREDFESYDLFWNKLVQYLSSGSRKERIYFEYEPYYYANTGITIKAGYYDKNYEFDPAELLQLEIIQIEGGSFTRSITMVAGSNTYEATLNGLPAGTYRIRLDVPSQNLSRTGEFTVLGYEVERQFINTDTDRMTALSAQTGGRMQPLNRISEVMEDLQKGKEFIPVQKRKENVVPLLEWKLLLFLTVLFFALEWFTRKYNGHI
ncbi:hypothetical protein [Robertkochia marina]|nr:hypothetical protein [Robertkochia marina]TRZ41036.1 hypothetical protein D3A96_14335 [Robertkochia marina]